MKCFKQIPILLFLYALLYLLVACESDKPNQPIENTIDTIAYAIDTTVDTTVDTTTIPDNFRVSIERTHGTIQGQQISIGINMHNPTFGNLFMGGYDLLVGYDANALSFQSVDPGQFLLDCGWEYFTYRFGPDIDSSSFKSLRIVAIAETNNGQDNHPDCYSDSGIVSNQLAVINFLVTNDRTRECTFAPVSFYWDDCNDNTISSVTGQQLFMNNHIYSFEDTVRIVDSVDLADDVDFPTYFGANSSCDSILVNNHPDSMRLIDFINGGVEIVCFGDIESRGDINLNEIAYEIADAVLFANYFVYGLATFTINTDGQIVESDVNADGETLTIADLVYHTGVIIGDVNPYPRDMPNQDITLVFTTVTRVISDGTLNVDKEMGAMVIVIEGNVNYELLNANMTVQSNFDGTNTHILVYSIEGNSFTGNFLKVLGTIVSIEFGSAEGAMVVLLK